MIPSELPAVLYCDDDVLSLRAFERSFRQYFRIFLCSSPNDALALLEQRRSEIGAVISDQRMPGMSGVELLERTRMLAPDAKRMLLTGYSDMQAMVDAVNRGQVTRCFVKPWDRANLLAALVEALRSAHLELKRRKLESQLDRQARQVQELPGIAHSLTGTVGSLSQNMAALRRNIAPVIDYVNKHMAQDNDRDVAEIMQDLPSFIDDVEKGVDHLRQVAHGLNAQAFSGQLEQRPARIVLPAHLVPLIEQRIAELLASTDARLGDYRSIATHYGALPIYADMGGGLALKPTGEWLSFHSNQRWDPPEEVEFLEEAEPLNGTAWRIVALRVGREKYPELAEMIPRRPADARDCPACHGTGHRSQGWGCGRCCGLGWEEFRIKAPGEG